MRVRVLAYAHTLPANLYTYLDAAFTAAGANNIVLGGLADPTKAAYGANNPAGKLVTWNLFPATTMTTRSAAAQPRQSSPPSRAPAA